MSGYLGMLVDDAASTLSRPAPLIIGNLVLQGHEVPGRISIGGAQAVTMHKMPGGGRIIDAMGADSGAISWRGIFTGPNAAQRARILDIMRKAGAACVLSFGDYTFNVIIVHFEYDYQDRGAVVTYRLKSEIVPDPTSLATGAAGLDLAAQSDLLIGQDLLQTAAAAALSYASLSGQSDAARITASAYGFGTIASGIGAVATIMALPTTGSVFENAALQDALETAGTTLQGTLGTISAGFPPSNAGSSFASAAALAAATGEAALLAAAVRSGGYVNRVNANQIATTGQANMPLIHA